MIKCLMCKKETARILCKCFTFVAYSCTNFECRFEWRVNFVISNVESALKLTDVYGKELQLIPEILERVVDNFIDGLVY